MEWKIGEIKQVNGEWYQCVVAIQGCRECSFRTKDYCTRHSECLSEVRSDGMSVIFKKLEKVGEPHFIYDTIFKDGKVYVQNFMVYEDFEGHKPICNDYVLYDWHKKIISIEIKENKEDMSNTETLWYGPDKKETKSLKLSNLKPFSLEAAKAGKPICTRDGRKARLIAVDLNNKTYPLAAVIENNGEENEVHNYTSDGLATYGTLNDADLMIITEKKEGWVNVYKMGARLETGGNIHKNQEEAVKHLDSDKQYIATVKIEWEE